MADVVVIVGTQRGGEDVPISELKQMAGRCARGRGARGDVYVLCDSARVESDWGRRELMDVRSCLNEDAAAFVVLPLIRGGIIRSVGGIRKWFSGSLAASQKASFCPSAVYDSLVECGAVTGRWSDFKLTLLGEVAWDFFLHPFDLAAVQKGFREAFDSGRELNDAVIASVFEGVSRWYCPEPPEEWRDGYSSESSAGSRGNVAPCMWAVLKCLPFGPLKAVERDLRSNAVRAIAAMSRLDGAHKGLWDDLILRFERRLPGEYVPFVRAGLTKGQASFLVEQGVRSVSEIAERRADFDSDIDDRFRERLDGVMAGRHE